MVRASPSVSPWVQRPSARRGTRATAGEREHGVGGAGVGSQAIEKGVWQPWDLFPTSHATPGCCLMQNIEVVLQPDPWSRVVGFFPGEVPRSQSLQYLAACYVGPGPAKCISKMSFVK